MDKLTEEEFDDILMIFNSSTAMEDIKKYIDDPELLEEYNKCIEISEQDPKFDATEIENKVYTYLLKRIRTENIPMIANNFGMLSIFMEHPEFVTDDQIPEEITTELIYNIMDINLYDAENLVGIISQNKDKWGLTDEQIQEFNETIANQMQSNSQDDPVNKISNGDSGRSSETDGDRKAREFRENLGITEDEIFSIKVYEGVTPSKNGRDSSFSRSGFAYETLNALLFPGMMNEAVRCCEDGKKLNIHALEDADEMLRIVTEMYSVMCKYSKSIDELQNADRMDRTMSYGSMKMTGTTNSFASCSLDGIKQFKKAHVTIFHMEVEPGVKCVDFSKILGPTEYYFSSEAELLVAPYEQIEMEEMDRTEWSSEDLRVKDKYGRPADKCIKARVKASEHAKPLSPEEKETQKKAMEVFSNPDLRKKASKALEILNKCGGMNPNDAINTIPVDVLNAYLEWKNAYHTVLKFRMREIELQVDKQFEDKQASQIQTEQETEQEEQPLQHEIDEAYMKLYETLYGKSLTSPVKKTTTQKVTEDIKNYNESEKGQIENKENKKEDDKENSER